jgi:hypothetical protein
MTRERAKSMDQKSLWTSGTAEAPAKLRRPPMGFPGTRQNASVCTVPRLIRGMSVNTSSNPTRHPLEYQLAGYL